MFDILKREKIKGLDYSYDGVLKTSREVDEYADKIKLEAQRKDTLKQVYDELNGCVTWLHIEYLLEDIKKELQQEVEGEK